MAAEILYKKEGRRFYPVGVNDHVRNFPQGINVVVVDKNYTMYKYQIPDQRAPFYGALLQCKEELVSALTNSSQTTWVSRPLSNEARQAWEDLCKNHGDEFRYLTYPSAHDIVENGLLSLENKITSMLNHPAVKDAYEKLLLTIELVANEEYNEYSV